MLDLYFCLPRRARSIIQAAARERQLIGLPQQRDDSRFASLDQDKPLVRGQVQGQIFLIHASCVVSLPICS